MAVGLAGLADQRRTLRVDARRSPRVDVLMRVKGELVPLLVPIIVRDLSRTGFAVVSPASFDAGQTLDFHLTGDVGPEVSVTARAVHSRPMASAAGLHLSGFTFVPGRLTGLVPQALIDQLIAAVSPRVPLF